MDKIAIPCSCGCSILVVGEWDAFKEDPQQFWVEFFTSVDLKTNRRSRWRAAWRVLQGKSPWLHDVCLDPNSVVELRDFLDKKLAQAVPK